MTHIDLQPLEAGLSALGYELPSGQALLWRRYASLLLNWNQRLNLTAVRSAPGIVQRHFLDSISPVLVTGDLNGQTLVDVGSGAGFPGIPLKILFPDMELTLVESVAKKAAFLQALVAELELAGVTILVERAERVGHLAEQREHYDWAVARAVAELRILLEYLLPLCRVDGRALALKGAAAAGEVGAASRALTELGGGPPQIHTVSLPGLAGDLVLVEVPKLKPTPERYPRQPGRPSKRPL